MDFTYTIDTLESIAHQKAAALKFEKDPGSRNILKAQISELRKAANVLKGPH